MKIVSFYSFKGGVGRSLSLVNVAYQLSQKGLRIGLIDLDIEAGGLNHILEVSVNSDRDLLSLLQPSNRDLSILPEYVNEISFRKGDKPRIFLLPTITDSVLLDQVKWDEATRHFLSAELLPSFERFYDLDFIFIDSRSGLSRFAALALEIGNLEMIICRLDAQNRYGIKRIVQICRAAKKPFKIVVSACPANNRLKHLRKFEEEINAKADFVLPYVADLYFEEFIISKRYPKHRLAKGYLEVAETIIHEIA